MVVGGREKKKRVQLDGTRVFLQKAVRDVHRVVVATLSGCAAGWRGCLLQVYIMCGRIDAWLVLTLVSAIRGLAHLLPQGVLLRLR